MTIRKYASGKILDEEEGGIEKSASSDWTEKDDESLRKENDK